MFFLGFLTSIAGRSAQMRTISFDWGREQYEMRSFISLSPLILDWFTPSVFTVFQKNLDLGME